MQFERDGAEHAPGAVAKSKVTIEKLLSKDGAQPGRRLVDRPDIEDWLDRAEINAEAARRIGSAARPIRAILFDKNDAANWSLGWHQDRTIAVRERREVEGFDRWTVKDGIQHVEPPFDLIERMATVRIHLDAVPETNAPLLVIPGSHRRGRLDDTAIAALLAGSEPFACLAQAGDAWWYHTAIVHASARASGGGHRRVLQVDYSGDALPTPLEWRGIA